MSREIICKLSTVVEPKFTYPKKYSNSPHKYYIPDDEGVFELDLTSLKEEILKTFAPGISFTEDNLEILVIYDGDAVEFTLVDRAQKVEPKLYYFAHPYSSNPIDNFRLCVNKTARLLEAGFPVFSPIVYSHSVDMKKSHNKYFWENLDNLIIRKCDFAGIILAPGWEDSDGCRRERNLFKVQGKPVLFYSELIDDSPRQLEHNQEGE